MDRISVFGLALALVAIVGGQVLEGEAGRAQELLG